MDYIRLLHLIDSTQPSDIPAMLEHLPDEAAYDKAAASIRNLAAKACINLV
jgi:hypothetical protein